MVFDIKSINGNCEITITDKIIKIRRYGFLSFMNYGFSREKIIRKDLLSAIEIRENTYFIKGYMQFIYSGSIEYKRANKKDENIVWTNRFWQSRKNQEDQNNIMYEIRNAILGY